MQVRVLEIILLYQFRMRALAFVAAGTCLLCIPRVGAAAPDATPAVSSSLMESCVAGRFQSHGDGTIRDTFTGLLWQRCDAGATWLEGACSGSPLRLTWPEAVIQAQGTNPSAHTWRLPTRQEIAGLTEVASSSAVTPCPEAVLTVFPVGGQYWTATHGTAENGSAAKDMVALSPRGERRTAVRAENVPLAVRYVSGLSEAAFTSARRNLVERGLPPGPDGFASCLKSTVPTIPQAGTATTSFYGTCWNGVAYHGIAVWSHGGEPFMLRCVSKGSLTALDATNSFDPCESYWTQIPYYCRSGDYRGQCQNGTPHGVGVRAGSVTAFGGNGRIFLEIGNFRAGQLNGFGYRAEATGCGSAGCSGSARRDWGWYGNGALSFACTAFSECRTQVSGAAYTSGPNIKSAELNSEIELERTKGTTAGFIKAFSLSGDRSDLKKAQEKAKAPAEKALLEHTLIRVAGFDKAFTLTVQVSDGQRSTNISDSAMLLGFIRSTQAEVPLSLQWKVKANQEAVRIEYGTYRVRATIGLDVVRSIKTCFGNICSNREDTDRYRQTTITELSRTKLSSEGSMRIIILTSDNSITLGSQISKDVARVVPVILIESIDSI